MNEHIKKVLELFLKGNPSESLTADFNRWLVKEENEKEKDEAIFNIWNEPEQISKGDSYKAYSSFLTKQIKQKRRRVLYWSYAAATVLIILSSSILFSLLSNKSSSPSNLNFVEHYSGVGEISTTTLPDGSLVEVNSATILMYPEDFGQNNRILYLSGEANFKVVKDTQRPFIVKSKGFSVTALGTEFNVTSYPDDDIYKATLISGSVRVSQDTEGDFEQVLNVGEKITYNRSTNSLLVQTTDLEDETAWQRGELVFRGVTISEMVKVLERSYSEVFHYGSKKPTEDKYNFKFKKDTSLEEVLEIMKGVVGDLDYKLTDDLCYIYVR